MGSSDYYLSIKELFSESVIGYLILFSLLFLLTVAQEWTNIILFIFPVITFSFAIFFKIIEVNKWRTYFEGSPIVYNPFGSEKKNANRFNVISLLLLIFLLWIGYESFIHPQLIDTYNIFFMIIYFFLYTFSFFILFFDIWKYSQIKLTYDKTNSNNSKESQNYEKIIRFLNIRKFRIISYINLGVFIILNGLNLLFSFLTYFGVMPGFPLQLPGTGVVSSNLLHLPFSFFIGLVVCPFYTIPLLLMLYKNINELRIEDLEDIINEFSKNMRILILENFQILNKNLLKDLDMEEFIKTMEMRKSFREYVSQRRAESVSEDETKEEWEEESIKREVKSKQGLIGADKAKEESTEKIIKQEGKSESEFAEKEEVAGAPKRTQKAKKKAKEIREIIKEESQKKGEEYHEKEKEHKEWVKKQASNSILTIKKSNGRRRCPNCDEDRKEMIHESIDKTNIIMSSPRIYGKKYKCGRCGTEWREK